MDNKSVLQNNPETAIDKNKPRINQLHKLIGLLKIIEKKVLLTIKAIAIILTFIIGE